MRATIIVAVAADVFESARDGPQVILAATDDSTTGLRALAYAAGLARRQGARLLIVHVVAVATPGNIGPLVVPGAAAAVDEVAERLRDEALCQAGRLGVDAEFVIAHGDAAHEIGVIADRRRVDAVVVAPRKEPGVGWWARKLCAWSGGPMARHRGPLARTLELGLFSSDG